MNPKDPDGFLSRQFCRLGEMIGDGEHLEPGGKWITRDYRRIGKALGYFAPKKRNVSGIDERMKQRVAEFPCPKCTGQFKQTRSGSKRARCASCGALLKREKVTEQDLIRVLISELRQWGWDIYQEVEGPGGRCDVVAKRGIVQWNIEAKLAFGFPVIEQAYNWRSQAHYSSICIPWQAGTGRGLANNVCRNNGIGVIRIDVNGRMGGLFHEEVRPRLNRRPRLLTLNEAQKDFCEAGGNRGGHWTPFKQTKRELISMVRSQPGIVFAELIKAIDHHYSSFASAKSCLRGLIDKGIISELMIKPEGQKLCVYLQGGNDEPDDD